MVDRNNGRSQGTSHRRSRFGAAMCVDGWAMAALAPLLGLRPRAAGGRGGRACGRAIAGRRRPAALRGVMALRRPRSCRRRAAARRRAAPARASARCRSRPPPACAMVASSRRKCGSISGIVRRGRRLFGLRQLNVTPGCGVAAAGTQLPTPTAWSRSARLIPAGIAGASAAHPCQGLVCGPARGRLAILFPRRSVRPRLLRRRYRGTG